MKRACWISARLIDARARGLTRAESLVLEEHVSSCASCAADAGLLSQLQRLSDASASSLQPSARARAIAAALAGQRQEGACVPMRTWFAPSALGAVLALGVIALGVTLRPAPAVVIDRLIAGEVLSSGHALVADEQVPEQARLYSEHGGTLALAHATIELRTQTHAVWRAETRTLHLAAGSLVADVDPSVGARFTVETERFRVIVLGTRFEVSTGGVSVERGRVRVQAIDGRELAVLTAGQRYDQPPATDVSADSPPQEVPEPLAASAAVPAKIGANQPAARARAATERARPGNALQPSAAERLDQARVALASGRVPAAREIVDAVLSGRPDAIWQAEALSLRAECALVEGHLQDAVSGYLLVADRYGKLAAGENALFAAARIEAEHGEPSRAVAALDHYLSRYPRGRFVKEAERRLRVLRAKVEP